MKKEAQLKQGFKYIFIAVVAGLILIFGIKIIKDLRDLEETVELKTFINNFQKEVDRVYFLPKESTQTMRLFTPQDLRAVCIINKAESIDYSLVNHEATEKLIKDTINKNIFFLPMGNKFFEPTFINNLVPENNPECIIIRNGYFTAKLVSQGTNVLIKNEESTRNTV